MSVDDKFYTLYLNKAISVNDAIINIALTFLNSRWRILINTGYNTEESTNNTENDFSVILVHTSNLTTQSYLVT